MPTRQPPGAGVSAARTASSHDRTRHIGRERERESEFLDPRRSTGLIEDRFRRHAPLPQRPAGLIATERPVCAATASNGLPDERGPAKIEHVIESRFGLLIIFHH